MTYAEWEDLVFRGIQPVESSPRVGMTLSGFNEMMTEYFREVVHPHVIEMQCKYPALFRGEFNITSRLKERYPSRRRTDEEMDKLWYDEMMKPSWFEKIKPKAEWQGGSFTIPIKFGSK